MDEPLKKRLLGAILLVGAAVIILASLLGGHEAGNLRRGDDTVHVAKAHPQQTAEPSGTQSTAKVDSRPAPEADKSSEVELRAVQSRPKELKPPQEGNKDTRSKSESPNKTPSSGSEATQPVPEPAVANSGAGEASHNEAGWVIQAASFKTRDRALTLKKRLEKDAFEVYIASGKAAGHSVYRVRVGPVHGEAEKQALTKKLRGTLGHDVLALKHE